LKILSLKNAIKALQLCHFRFGGQKPLKFSGFLILKKKKFCLFCFKIENIVNKSLAAVPFPVWGAKTS